MNLVEAVEAVRVAHGERSIVRLDRSVARALVGEAHPCPVEVSIDEIMPHLRRALADQASNLNGA